MLTVDAIHKKEIEVELDDWTVKNIVLDNLYEIFDIPHTAYIKDGNIIVDVEVGGGLHSWFNEEIIREATNVDYAALLVIQKVIKEL